MWLGASRPYDGVIADPTHLPYSHALLALKRLRYERPNRVWKVANFHIRRYAVALEVQLDACRPAEELNLDYGNAFGRWLD